MATSSFHAAIIEAVQVGGVWTPPALRRRGCGRAAVAASLLDARAKGVAQAILFTGAGNLAAQRAYQSSTVAFSGHSEEDELASEAGHPYGRKVPRWLSAGGLKGIPYHPPRAVQRALAMVVA